MDTELSPGNRLVEADSIIMSKEKDSYAKSVMIRDVFKDLLIKYKIEKIVVEENLQAFRRGLSSAKTLSTLARFNGIVCFLAQDVFQVSIEMINVNTARKVSGIKVDRKSTVTIKEQVLVWIKKQPDFAKYSWPIKTLKSGPRKNETIQAPQCYDIADAAVVCLSSFKLEH